MTELERLTKRLFSDDSVRKLVNFKLFRGDDATTTQEQLCAEINKVLDQLDQVRDNAVDEMITYGLGVMARKHSLDGHLTTTHINDFVGK